MNTQITRRVFFWISFIVMFIQSQNEAFASHAQSADITYQCLGGNQYRINLSFYRDCAGVAAPTTASIDISSASCGQNLTLTLNPITGTGIEVSPICSQMATQCSGGSYPGVQEYKYSGIITLPMACTDWTFSFSLCCRNASINTIVNPSAENIYVEATLNNLNYPCNNSPTFSNPPIPFVCMGQPYCFNNGSSDADGDSLSYALIVPRTGPTTSVVYNSPYSASQPLLSSPPVTFDAVSGDMCMAPTQLEVTVFACLVTEWRNGVVIGTVMRDIQLRTINCTNNNPYVNGINNSGTYSMTACAGVPLSFMISSYDADSSQSVSLNWNNGIAGASFASSGGSRPVGTFTWIPSTTDISSASHCFTVTVRDDNCPYNGNQTFSFCITVTGPTITTSTTTANCNASNGTASAQVISGNGPFTYLWSAGGTNNIHNGLSAGTYTVTVTDAAGCSAAATATVGSGAAPGNLVINSANSSCYGSNNGTATANVNGGQPPYAYLWSNGATTSTIDSLAPGTYSVTVTTANGCVTNGAVTITQPVSSLNINPVSTNVLCNGGSDGTITLNVTGATGPYSYNWSGSGNLTGYINNLTAGNYSCIVSDANGCSITVNATITEPPMLSAIGMVINNVTCNGLSDGYAIASASGGTAPYYYSWNTSPIQNSQTATGLSHGNYFVTVTDSNGCTVNSSVSITEPSPLTLSSAAFPVSCNGLCNGQGIVIPAGGTPGYIYQWLPDGGTSASATGLCPGTYSATVTDGNGCTITASMSIVQPPPLTVAASGSTTICSGQNTTITAVASGGTGTYTYSWTGIGTGATQTVSPSASHIYNVTAMDANGCLSSASSVSIHVTSLTAANLVVSAPTTICFGNNAIISSAVSGDTGPVTIGWSGGLGSGNGPFTIVPPASITYTVTVTDVCGNSVTGSVPVTVHALPIVELSPQTITSCKEATLLFNENSGTNLNATFNWDFDDGSTSTSVTPSHTYYMTGHYNVNLSVISSYGCENSATTICNVVVNKMPDARFSAEALDGTTISPQYKFTNQSEDAVSYTWDFGDGSGSTVTSPEHSYPSKGEYKVMLIAVSNAGCVDSIMRSIEISPVFTLYIPNAFTPDNNGVNDNFIAKGAEVSDFNMMIFDRWGEMIYQTSDMQKGWDGTANHGSRTSESGVYVYKITVRDFEQRYHDYTGHVTLLTQE